MQYTNKSFLIDVHCNKNGDTISDNTNEKLDEINEHKLNNHRKDEIINNGDNERDKNKELIAALEISKNKLFLF